MRDLHHLPHLYYADEIFVDSNSEEGGDEDDEIPSPPIPIRLPGATKGIGLPVYKDQVLGDVNETEGSPTTTPTPSNNFDTSGTSATTSLRVDGSQDTSSRDSSSFQMSGLTINSLVPSFARNREEQELQASAIGASLSSPEPIVEDDGGSSSSSDEEENSNTNNNNNNSMQPLEIEADLVQESYVIAEVVDRRFGARCVIVIAVLLIGGISSGIFLFVSRNQSTSRQNTPTAVPQTLQPSAAVTETPTMLPTAPPTPRPTLIPVDPVSWVSVQNFQGPSEAMNFGASLGTTNKGWKILTGYNGGVDMWEKRDNSEFTLWSANDPNQTVIGRLAFDGLVAVYVASDPINGTTMMQIVRQTEDESSWESFFGGIPQESIQTGSERYWLDQDTEDYGEFLALAQQAKNVTAVGGVGFVKIFHRRPGENFKLVATLREPSVRETHQFGWSVDVDAYGNYLVVGAPSINPCCTGRVFVYRWSESNFRRVDQLDGMLGAGRFGHAVKFSGDGSLLLVSGTLLHNGHVLSYRWQGNRLVQLGGLVLFNGNSTSNGFGSSLGADYNGTNIAIGHPFLDDSTGGVFMYQWNGEDWAERGDKIIGSGSRGGCFGSTLIMTREGEKVIVAAPKEGNGIVYVIEPFVPENPFACRVCNDGAKMLNPNRVIPEELISPDFKQITGGVDMTCYLVDLVGQNKYLPSACPIIEDLFYIFCGCEGSPPPVVCNLCSSPEEFPSNYDKILPQSLVQELYPSANFQMTCGNAYEAGRQGSFFSADDCSKALSNIEEIRSFCGCS